LRNIILHHQNIAPNNINIIDNNGRGNCLYNSISYHIYSNFNHQRTIQIKIANKSLQIANQIPMITINNNSGINISINLYAKNVFNDGERGGDAEISMILLIYSDICVATYRLVNNINNKTILGYEFINIYGNIEDINKTILILININNNHWCNGYYEECNEGIIENYIIPSCSLQEKIEKI